MYSGNSYSIRSIKHRISEELAAIYDMNEAKQIASLLIEHYCNLNKTEQALQANNSLSTETLESIQHALEKLKECMPLQYVLGETEFFGRRFEVTNSVLIPRVETEELVQYVIQTMQDSASPKILDIGTGSGAIAISLAKELKHAKVYASDISQEALQVARKNASTLNAHVEFIHHDILSGNKNLPSQLDCIVSNPPYVRESEKVLMHENVLSYEPHTALFVTDNDALIFYENIAKIAKLQLKSGGFVICEINEALAEETKKCFEANDFGNIFVFKDINQKNRVIKAQRH